MTKYLAVLCVLFASACLAQTSYSTAATKYVRYCTIEVGRFSTGHPTKDEGRSLLRFEVAGLGNKNLCRINVTGLSQHPDGETWRSGGSMEMDLSAWKQLAEKIGEIDGNAR